MFYHCFLLIFLSIASILYFVGMTKIASKIYNFSGAIWSMLFLSIYLHFIMMKSMEALKEVNEFLIQSIGVGGGTG